MLQVFCTYTYTGFIYVLLLYNKYKSFKVKMYCLNCLLFTCLLLLYSMYFLLCTRMCSFMFMFQLEEQ